MSAELKPGYCHKCGMPYVSNPHPDAGKPAHYLEVGCQKECLPCTVLSRHQWAKRAMKAESRVQELERQLAERDAERDAQAKSDPIRELIAKHAELLESGPYAHYCYFELAFTRYTGWMAWICSNQREADPNRKILAKGQGSTPDEACRAAIAAMSGTAPANEQEKANG